MDRFKFSCLIQAKMRKKGANLGNGRCQSLDCGMLVDNSVSLDCKQCISRKTWLVSRSRAPVPPIERVCVFYSNPELKRSDRLVAAWATAVSSIYMLPSPFTAVQESPLRFSANAISFLPVQAVRFSQSHFCIWWGVLCGRSRFQCGRSKGRGRYQRIGVEAGNRTRWQDKIQVPFCPLPRDDYLLNVKNISPERLVSFLDGGGISIRFCSMYPVPILQDIRDQVQDQTSIAKFTKNMQCELEIATLPDYSHRFIPGQRIIIRFRLLW
jgi:hypothetical protein